MASPSPTKSRRSSSARQGHRRHGHLDGKKHTTSSHCHTEPWMSPYPMFWMLYQDMGCGNVDPYHLVHLLLSFLSGKASAWRRGDNIDLAHGMIVAPQR